MTTTSNNIFFAKKYLCLSLSFSICLCVYGGFLAFFIYPILEPRQKFGLNFYVIYTTKYKILSIQYLNTYYHYLSFVSISHSYEKVDLLHTFDIDFNGKLELFECLCVFGWWETTRMRTEFERRRRKKQQTTTTQWTVLCEVEYPIQNCDWYGRRMIFYVVLLKCQ